MRIVSQRALPALACQRQHERQRRVVEGEGRCAWHAARHVGDTVVRHAIDNIHRIGVRRRMRGLEAPALVDRHVDDHRTRLHLLDQRRRDELRCRSAGDQHAADDEIGRRDVTLDRVARREHRVERTTELPPERAQHFGIAVEHPDLGAHAKSDMTGMRSDHAAAQDDDLGRIDAGHATEQHTETAVRLFKVISACLDRHPAGDFRHRRQQWQASRRRRDRLVGDAHGAARQ